MPRAGRRKKKGKGKSVILVAEDDPVTSRVLDMGLKRAGYRVLIARDGVTALETARALKPGLIILDIMMPRMGGFEVLKNLRSDRRNRKIPVLMLTARSGQSDREKAIELGADHFETKPFTFRRILPTIEGLLKAAKGKP